MSSIFLVSTNFVTNNYFRMFSSALLPEEDCFAFTPGVSRFGFIAFSGTAQACPKRSQPGILPSNMY
jgi:hypothetical protein